ncbi:hypothetical protein L208DRAFT_1382283 [Tricholoma matsutake]|nr:hypothetical protein L208DRAFT_1382283 [Tricholoma matsutake 945]
MHAHTGLNIREPTGALSSQRDAAPSNAGLSNTRMQAPIQPTTQPPAQQNCPANQLPTQQNQPNTPLKQYDPLQIPPPTRPITPVGGNHQPASSPQVARPAAGGNNSINTNIAPPAAGPIPQSQADEIQSRKAQLKCYEKDGTLLATLHQPQSLFSDQDTINHVKAATTSLKDKGKKLVLPDVVPGFKASSLKVTLACHMGDPHRTSS